MEAFVRKQLEENIRIKEALLAPGPMGQILKMTELWIQCLKQGGKILLAGNGGSAADAQHIAGELVSRFFFNRPALAAVALTTDTSILTAIGNDFGFEQVFARQVEALGKPGDIFVGISTSGSSKNVLAAFEQARQKGLVCMALAGEKVGPMNEICDLVINVPSTVTPRVQEVHILIGHLVCAAVEMAMFNPPA